MQLILWWPEDYVAPGVPFYIPVSAKILNGSGDYTFEWDINNKLQAIEIPYESYAKKNILSIGFYNVGTLRVTCTATDNKTGEVVSEEVELNGYTEQETGRYYFDEVPVATYYDDTYLPDFAIEWEKKFSGSDAFDGGFIYYIGKYKFIKWDPEYDYSTLEDAINEVMNRTLQPDQMWERYFDSECQCQYAISDPVESYIPNKVTLLHMFTAEDGIGFHIRLRSDFSLQCAIGRLYQALAFVCFAKDINLEARRTTTNTMYTSHLPIAYYDQILDALDEDIAQTYANMKKTVDADYIYELLQDETITFLSKKSYDNDIELKEWGPDMSVFTNKTQKTDEESKDTETTP